MQRSVAVLRDGMAKYAGHLMMKCVTVNENHTALTPVHSTSDCESFCVQHGYNQTLLQNISPYRII